MLSPLSNTYRLHESSVSIYQIDASSPEYLIASVVAGAKIQVSPDLLTSNPSYAKNGVPKPIGYDVSLEARRWSFSGNNIKLNNLYVDKKLNIYIRLDATPVTGSTGLIVITPNDYDIDGYFIEKIEEDGSAASSVVAETTRTEEDGVEEVLNRPGYRYVMENVGSEEEPDMQKKQKDSDYFYICIGNIYTENGLRKYVIDNGSYNTQYQIDKDKDSNAMFELTKSLSGNHVIRPLMPFLELTIDGTLTIGGVAVNSIINDDQMQKFVKAWNDNKPSDMEDWTLDETIVTTQALITYITYITSHFLRKDAPDATPYALGVGSLVSAGDMSAAGSISSSAKVLTPVIESSNDDKVLYAKDIIDVAKRVVADAVSAHFSNDLSLNGKVFIDAEGGMRHADFTPDIITGQRWSLNGMGEGEFESLVLRSFLRVPMLDFNKVTVSSGTSWDAPGCGVIKSVGVGDDGCDFFDIKLERGEIGSFAKCDICMGVWHFEGEDSRLNASDGDAKNDDSGTSVAGFCKVLFMITEVEDYVADGVSYTNGRCHVGYRLLDGAAHGHVAESMTVVAYGHDITLDSVPGRLSSEQVNGDNFMFPDELDFMSNERTRSWYKTTKFQRYLVNMNGGTFMHLRDKNNAYVEDDGVSYNDESKYRIEVLDGKRYVFVRYKKSKWDIAFPYNVGMHLGDTTDMYVDDVKTGGKVALSNYSAFLSNVYFYGFLQHIDISQLSDTEGLLASTNYQVDLTSSSATVNVDADGGLQLFDETGRALVQTAVYVHRGDSPMIYIDDFSDAAWSKEAERLGLAEVSEKDRRNYYRLMVAVDGIGSLDSQGALIEGSGYSKEGTSVTVKAILASAVAKGSASVTFTVLPYKSDVALQKIFFIKFTYDGSVGLSVFTSYVFKRFTWGLSADSIAVPEGGSFTSPLPSTGGWTDSIPEGEGEVWMAQRRFYSDGSEADGGEHANAWVLARMTDTEFLDVEFTAAAEYKPLLYADGSPVHGNSKEALARKKQLGWVEAVDGANAIWMATSHYADGKWSEWNYVKVKGENGDPGLSVFTSYVFKRFAIGTSADSIAVPQGGSFTSPLPSTGGWSDSIPEGEGEVWMAQRRFYSDGSEADDGEHANAWVLARMTDTEFLDVEFTAAANYKPLLYTDGTPVHGNSEKALARKKQLGWVEAVDGANAIWMATSHYADGKWSAWNYVKVKGENGDPGLSVFTSYVFKRFAIGTSADSIAVPQGGSFTSPLPSTGGWSDSIPEGEGEVWMAQRRFYSDGSEADGGEHANAWVLARMTDTEFLDVEFTAAAEYKPLLYADGSPVHGNSEKALARKKQLGWVEAVDGANAIWMATSHYSDGKWSEWNYVKVKGENGDPGLSVFTSYVFKRFAIGTSADSIAVPEGGSFSSPLPSTGGWSDSIPEGEGEVWMAQRRFYSDGSEADGGEHANAWVLARMTDTEFLDVEFTAAAEYKPLLYADGSPVHGNSEKALARKKQLGWTEAVDGANAVWMATSHYADGKWSAWNYVKVKGEDGEPGDDGLPGLPGLPGVSALTASVTPSSIVIDCDSEGRAKESGNRTFSFHVFDGDSQTESYTVAYGSIASCFQLNASLNKLAWSKGSSIVSASIDISISCKDRTVHLSVPVVANKQGASSLGQLSKMARNRGAFSSLQTYFNNEFWSDYVRVGSSYIFFLGDSVERWDGQEGKYYFKGGSGLATASLYPSASASGDIMDGGRVIWKRVSNVGDLAAGRIIADSINSGNANIGEVFIGKTSTGAVDIQGGVSVDDSADGWLIQSGRIVHTKTGLSLTADGYLDNPDGLHLSVSGSPTNAVLPPSANMLPDPILNNPHHFGYDESKKAIPVHGIGTTSSDKFWATSLVQTGSSSTFLNFTSPWADDGGRVVSLHFGADYVPSQSKYVYTQYVKSNRVAILTSIPLDGSSDMKQRNIYTFSVWAKNASSDFLFNSLAEARVFVSALGDECSWLYLGIERSASNGGVRTIASGIASEIEGWVQYYVTFEVVFGSSAQSGSAAYADKAYFDWMPYVNAKKKNMYVSFAGAKLEKGDKPTPMTYLSGSLKRAGIDISKGEVVLTADKFLCRNLEGEKTAWLDDTGVFIANGVFTSPVNIIDWDNNVGCDKIIVAFKDADGNFIGYLDNDGNYRLMSGDISDKDEWEYTETVVYLDVLRLGDTVKILSLPADAIGSGGSDLRFLEFPYYIDGEFNCRTLTRFNGKSDSVPRLVKADEMRMLGGKRITLLLNNAVSTPYTLAQCFFLSYASSYLSPDLQTANATYVYKYPTNGMIYDGHSGMGLNGIRVVTLECRSAFFYDDKGNKSCYGYAWVSSRDETLSQFGNNLDSWT